MISNDQMRDLVNAGIAITGTDGDRVDPRSFYRDPVGDAARQMNAKQTDIAGLWEVPGYPELTTGQLLQVAAERHGDE